MCLAMPKYRRLFRKPFSAIVGSILRYYPAGSFLLGLPYQISQKVFVSGLVKIARSSLFYCFLASQPS